MKRIVMIGLLGLACAGCAGGDGKPTDLGLVTLGSDGNPDSMPYAGQPGGTLAAAPQDVGRVAYDPAAPNPSADSNITAPVLGSNGGVPVKSPSTGPYLAPAAKPR